MNLLDRIDDKHYDAYHQFRINALYC